MIDYRNPYAAGSDESPKYLAGRDDILEAASLQIKALAANYQKSLDCFVWLEGCR